MENLIGDGTIASQILGQSRKGRRTVEVAVEYETTKPNRSLPVKITLVLPAEEDCCKLRTLFAETLDTRVISLACLPGQLRNEGFLDQLTEESRTRLTNAALGLVIPEWRTLVTATM